MSEVREDINGEELKDALDRSEEYARDRQSMEMVKSCFTGIGYLLWFIDIIFINSALIYLIYKVSGI